MPNNAKVERVLALLKVANEDFATNRDVGTIFNTLIAHINQLKQSFETAIAAQNENGNTIAAANTKHRNEVEQSLDGHKAFVDASLETAIRAIASSRFSGWG
jgi:hypothetical protein